jgi:hypothetical protein
MSQDCLYRITNSGLKLNSFGFVLLIPPDREEIIALSSADHSRATPLFPNCG